MKKVEAPCKFCDDLKHSCMSFVQSMGCVRKARAEEAYRRRHPGEVQMSASSREARQDFFEELDDDD